MVARFTTDGSLDTTFGVDGPDAGSDPDGWRADDYGGLDRAAAVAIDSQGRIVIGGTGGSASDFIAGRYTASGAFDTTFNGTGKQTVTFGVSSFDSGEEMSLDSYGRIVIAGTAAGDFGITRLKSDGTLDTTFGTGGTTKTDFNSGGTDQGRAMTIQPDGKIIVVGASTSAGNSDFAIARYSGGGARHYLIQDANYNVTATADGMGRVLDRYQYTPYGQWTALNEDFTADINGNGEVYQAFYFQGLRFDGNSGNHHARNRDYRASLGRWTQNDPAGYVDGGNLYESFGGSPTDRADASGLAWQSLKAQHPYRLGGMQAIRTGGYFRADLTWDVHLIEYDKEGKKRFDRTVLREVAVEWRLELHREFMPASDIDTCKCRDGTLPEYKFKQYVKRELQMGPAAFPGQPQGLDNVMGGTPGKNQQPWREGVSGGWANVSIGYPSLMYTLTDEPTIVTSFKVANGKVQDLYKHKMPIASELQFKIEAYKVCKNQKPELVDTIAFGLGFKGEHMENFKLPQPAPNPAKNFTGYVYTPYWETGQSLKLMD